MSIMSMFQNAFGGAAPAAPAPAASQPAQPGNLPAAPVVNSDPANNNAPAPNPADPASVTPEGLDAFKDLWKAPESPTNNEPQPMFNVKPEQLLEAAKKIDFSKAITQDQLQAVAQGGENAVNAFAQAMNSVAQTVYAQNALATTKIVEQALAKSKEGIMSEIPGQIKRHTVSETLQSENPVFSHPAAAPVLGALQQQLAIKYPNASASELSQHAKQYLNSLLSAASPANKSTETADGSDEDWSRFLVN